VTGKWSGSFNATNPNGETKESTAVLVLKQTGTDITGTVGPNEDEQFPKTTLQRVHLCNERRLDNQL
jgi:hypothetical protein